MVDKLKQKIAVYGLSTETERMLPKLIEKFEVIGLLDGFRTEGAIYGKDIISLDYAIKCNINMIIVIARPGSCKAIAKKIGIICRENNIELFDIRGKDLLDAKKVSYCFEKENGYTHQMLLDQIKQYDVISFDLFDTLVMRKVMSNEDIIEISNLRLQEKGIFINEFENKRLAAEKQLSQGNAPTLSEIYERAFGTIGVFDSRKLSEWEFNNDLKCLVVREDMRKLIEYCYDLKKKICITTESYYTKGQIEKLLWKFGITKYDELLVSCMYHTGKNDNLFDILKEKFATNSILHIGDDLFVDYQKAKEHGISAFLIYSGVELFDQLGGMGLEYQEKSLSDKIKIGMFIARLFNSPFQFENENLNLQVNSCIDIGFLFCASIINDFTQWFIKETKDYKNIWFGARDGYLLQKLYKLYTDKESIYFLTSRNVAIRSGVSNIEDIKYVDSMKFSGSLAENLYARFGIIIEESLESDDSKDDLCKYTKQILEKSEVQKKNYNIYIKSLLDNDKEIAFFDFVAKGTSQMFIEHLINNKIKGFYFLQLEPEFMREYNLLIEPFYDENERVYSTIFDNYYILETILTSASPSVNEFDSEGTPQYAEETRTIEDIQCVEKLQEGVKEFTQDYINICPQKVRGINKILDEKFLMLIQKICLTDNNFLNLKIEDPFFNRMTDIKDIL